MHKFIVSKGILMCPSCIYMQDMFCISDKKYPYFDVEIFVRNSFFKNKHFIDYLINLL